MDLWPDYDFELVGYIARQSLISATSPANPRDFRTNSISSPFQKRMADGDIRGNVLSKLSTEASTYDFILWDITDERLGLYSVPSGGYVSRVVNYANGVYTGKAALGEPIRLGSSSHRKLWLRALDKFVESLEVADVKDRLILNAIPWATIDEAGNSTAAQPIAPHDFNELLEEYSAEVARRGIHVAHTDPTRVVQATTHKWGPAPFHYVPDTYLASLDAVRTLL